MWIKTNGEESYELQHHGVLGMKWGVRRAIYKARSAGSLKKSARGVKNDITKLETKANKNKKKAAKFEKKAAKRLKRGNSQSSGKYFKKSAKQNKLAAKRGKTILHNKKLLKLYNTRIKELEADNMKTERVVSMVNQVLTKKKGGN